MAGPPDHKVTLHPDRWIAPSLLLRFEGTDYGRWSPIKTYRPVAGDTGGDK